MLPYNDDKTIYIIDGYGFIFRAFYAVPNLTTTNGEPIGAVFGFFKMLISLINSAKPNYLVVALDTGKRTFRNDIYDEFLENKAITEIFNCAEYSQHFNNVGLICDDVKTQTANELVETLKIDKEKLQKLCESCGVGTEKPPKVLILLMFLGLSGNINVEDYKTQYKANRAPTPDALKGQFKIVRELISSMGLASESVVGYEADDVIGTISKEAVQHGYQAIIVSADKDLCQLVEDGKIAVYDPVKKQYLNEHGVFEKFGVKAKQVCDYLSIVGDHCDNVFGVNGIGPKGAIKLLEKYGSLENILLHLNELDEKISKKFKDSLDVLELAHDLINLKYDALDVESFEKYRLNVDHRGLGEFVAKYGFKSLDKTQRESGFLKKRKVVNGSEDSNLENDSSSGNSYKQGTLF